MTRAGIVELLPGREQDAAQVREARYEPGTERVALGFGDGAALDMGAGEGVER